MFRNEFVNTLVSCQW